MSSTKPQFRESRTPNSRTPNPKDTGTPVVVPAQLDPRAAAKDLPTEIGGYKGPEPTRFGDWEHKGRCTDF